MTSAKYTTESEEQTIEVAANFIEGKLNNLKTGPVIISLQGDYGVGKTQFVKGLAVALGIKEEIVSPSYVYIRNYPFETRQGKGELVHIDAWRVKSESDFQLLGVEKYLKPGFILAIEWPQNYAVSLLKELEQGRVPSYLVEVSIKELEDDQREINISHKTL